MLRLIHHVRHGLQAKPRVALTVGLGIFAAAAIYTFTRPKIYEATATFVYPQHVTIRDTPNEASPVRAAMICGEDINSRPTVAKSTLLAKRVAQNLTRNDAITLSGPSPQTNIPSQEELVDVLLANRRVSLDHNQENLLISLRHREPDVAARIANLYAGELLNFMESTQTEANHHAIEYLRRRVEQERLKAKTTQETLSNLTTAGVVDESPDSPTQPTPEVVQLKKTLPEQQGFLAQLEARLHEASQHMAIRHHSIIPATPPSPSAYVEPDIPRNLSIGLFAGLVLGTTAASFAARSTPSPNRVPEV